MRLGVIAAILWIAAPAAADPDPIEASGFFGGQYFAPDVGLGGSRFTEQRPQTSSMFGARVSILALPSVAGDDDTHLDLGFEAEFTCAAAFTGYGFDSGRDSYFAPVLGWRGELLARLSLGKVRPHLVVGGGGASVVSSSPYMTKETVGEFVWGLGATFSIHDRWQLRFDGRQGFLPTMSGGVSPTFEGSIGIGTTFGIPREHVVAPPVEPPPARVAPPPDADRDGDGIPDSIDQCPNEPETVNGIKDGDGCPEEDPDGDGIVGAADLCPNEPEDYDHFQDEDGCPDPDNDHDGILDAHDACPNQPETFNGFEDEDGCPDTVPANVQAALAAAASIKFESGKARLGDPAKQVLDKAIDMLRAHPQTRVTVVVHPDKGDATKTGELAKRRGGVIKGYMEEQGIASEQIAVIVSPDPVAAKGPTIELLLAVGKLPGH